MKKHHIGELHKKRYYFATSAANHTFFDSPCITRITITILRNAVNIFPRVVIKLFWTALESNWRAIMLLFFNLWKKETYREQNIVFKWRFSKIGSIKYLWVSLGRLIKLYRPYSMINIIVYSRPKRNKDIVSSTILILVYI